MLRRRAPVLAGLSMLAGFAGSSRGQQRKPGDAPLRVGVEQLLVDAGLSDAWRRGFAAATGLAARLEGGTSSALLAALEDGEFDIAITHAPVIEARLEAQGLVHDRHAVAQTDFVIVGPVVRGRDAAGVAGMRDAAPAIAQIARAELPFITRNDGSGTHLAEQDLWRAAGVSPNPPWYRPMQGAAGSLMTQARAGGAYAFVDRASWLREAGAGFGLLVEGDPRLTTFFQVQRAFRAAHPAGKLFVSWLAGRRGQSVAARTRGFRMSE